MNINFGNYGMYRSMFGGGFGSSFYGSLGDYSSIRSGSYKKLLTSYYAKTRESQRFPRAVTSVQIQRQILFIRICGRLLRSIPIQERH